MESGKQLVRFMLFAILVLLIAAPANASLNSYFSQRMNFYKQQLHVQAINFSGNLSVTVPVNFTVYNYTGGATNSSGIINWSASSNIMVNYTLQGPTTCAEGTRYFSNISVDGAFAGKFTFVCVPDSKIVDYKAEYGHGDANYLTENFISNETSTVFNLIRVFNIGNFLEPNEDAFNATINCTFPDFPIRTYGRVEVTRSNGINGGFFWERIEGGYWFRIGVISQDISNVPVGYQYNVTCNSLTYDFSHHRVVAGFTNTTLEIRDTKPFNTTVTDNSDRLTYTIKNAEKYSIKNAVFKWTLNNFTRTEELNAINPNDTLSFDLFLEGSGTVVFSTDFVPSWFANSRNPSATSQSRSDAYNFNTRSPRIVNLDVQLLRAVNQTVQDIRISQERYFRAELSDFGETIGNQNYRARLLIYGFEGRPLNATATPRILIYDPLRNLIVNSTMTHAETGVYIYNYTTSQSMTTGVYETVVEANVSDVVVKPNDFWELENSPAQVKINRLVDEIVPAIIADVIIQNEGSADAEYQYEYCIVINESNQCGGDDDIDFASAAKLVVKGEIFNPLLTLNVPSTGEYYFKVVVFFGTEASGATKKFTAVPQPPEVTTGAGGGTGAGGTQGGGTGAGGSTFDIDLKSTSVFSMTASEGDIKILTFDSITSHIMIVETVGRNSVVVVIRSNPITVSLTKGETKNVDINKDSFDDISLTLTDIINSRAFITVKKLAGAVLLPKRSCLEDWVCTDFSQCYIDGFQIRTCKDRSECATIYDKPAERRSCYYAAEPVAGVDFSGLSEYLSSTQSEIKLFAYIVLLTSILSTITIFISMSRKPKWRESKLFIHKKKLSNIKLPELSEEDIERKIARLDYAYNRGLIDKATRNIAKSTLQGRLKKVRKAIRILKSV